MSNESPEAKKPKSGKQKPRRRRETREPYEEKTFYASAFDLDTYAEFEDDEDFDL